MARQVSEAANVTILLDGVPIVNATSADVTRAKAITKTDVIGTKDKRISEGSVEYSGTLTELRHNDFGVRLVRNKLTNNLDFQPLVDVTGTPTRVGANNVQRTLTTVNVLETQDFEALGNSLDYISLLMDRDASYTDDITIRIKDGVTLLATLTLPNSYVNTTKKYTQFLLELDERVALTRGNVYTMEVEHSGVGGDVRLYGNNVQDFVLVGTGDDVTTAFDLLHTNVEAGTLFVRKNDGQYLGQTEGYSFSDGTGTAGVDQVSFTTAPATGEEIYAKYEHDTDALFAWRLGFGDAANPQYTMRFEHRNEQGDLLDAYTINGVRFASNSISISPGSFVERTLSWDGVSEDSVPC